ncbi:MAG: protein translocase subunit SecD [Pseudomonadota bacterium]
MQPYPLWKTLTLVFVTLLGVLYALPNLYGQAPAVQVNTLSGDPLPADFAEKTLAALAAASITAETSHAQNKHWIFRFATPEQQLKASDTLKRALGNSFIVALSTDAKTPAWLLALGAKPMSLGLDLRGGVHFLLEVDIDVAKKAAAQRYVTDLPNFLRKESIRYTARRQDGETTVLEFADGILRESARKAIAKEFPELTLDAPETTTTVTAKLSETEAKRIVDFAVQQNLTTLRNRVNQLGVAEPLVQRQGVNRIVVQLPAVQDSTRVKDLLGATATLEYRAVEDSGAGAESAAASGIIPPGSSLFFTREGRRPALLKNEVIAAGVNLVDAAATVDENGSPAVSIKLDSAGGKRMFAFTEKNVGKSMAVLFKETVVTTNYNAEGVPMREKRNVEEIISIATIQGVFGNQFRTTGLESKEAQSLSVLLKAGALAAPIEIVEERTVGPSLGADNIEKGFTAALLGLGLVSLFMAVYYRVFGLFAIAALVLNLVLVVAVLSLLGAALTVPGIAGIVLHMGIAVDANVLIYERIREELRNGVKPHEAIQAGYDRAFLTIADANVTVLIGTVMLFALGAGPVKGFAITLAIGILTSQFTAIVGSRALAQLVFGRKTRLKDLPIW